MTDPYAETDDWPTAPATRPSSDAQPVSAPEPSGSTPEAGEGARVARYAEMVCAHHCSAPHPSVKALVAVHGREARAFMAMADREQAELRESLDLWGRLYKAGER